MTIYQTQLPQDTLRSLYAIIASNQGVILTSASLARELSLLATTVNKLLCAFESLFLIRKFDHVYFSEDQGLANFANINLSAGTKTKSIRSEILGMTYGELRCQIAQQQAIPFKLTSFKTRGGASVPFIITNQKGLSIGITVDTGKSVSEKSLKSLTIWEKQTRSELRKIALHQGPNAYQSSTGTVCIPMTWIF